MRGQCIGCGGCCEYLAALHTKRELVDMLAEPDRSFVRENWHEVPQSHRKCQNILMPREIWLQLVHFKCDQFDKKTKRCKDYEHRPEPCRRYPPSIESSRTLMCDRCGYMPEGLRRVELRPPTLKEAWAMFVASVAEAFGQWKKRRRCKVDKTKDACRKEDGGCIHNL